MKTFLWTAAAILLTALLAGCGEEEGPAEQMGKNVDEAVEEMAEQVEREGPAEQAGEKVDQALDQAGESLRNAGKAVGETMQSAGQELEEQSGG